MISITFQLENGTRLAKSNMKGITYHPDLLSHHLDGLGKRTGPSRVGSMRGAELPGFGYVKIFSSL